MSEALTIYTIYKNVAWCPAPFAVGITDVQGMEVVPRGEVLMAWTLDDARAAVPSGLVRIERTPADDPAVCEVWL
jgi:hypothetical protein